MKKTVIITTAVWVTSLVLTATAIRCEPRYVKISVLKDPARHLSLSNPVTVSGRVVSASPMLIYDGSAIVEVSNLSALVGDHVVVTGNWNGSVLSASGSVDVYSGSALSPVTAGWTNEPLGMAVVICKDVYWLRRLSDNVWIGTGKFADLPADHPWKKAPKVDGKWVWEFPEGITAGWDNPDTTMLTVISKDKYWNQQMADTSWLSAGKFADLPADHPWKQAPKLDGKWVWEFPEGITAGWINRHVGLLAVVSKDKYWNQRLSDKTWLQPGRFADLPPDSNWKKAPKIEGKWAWGFPEGITAAWVDPYADTLTIVSTDKYWMKRLSDNVWLSAGRLSELPYNHVWKQGSLPHPLAMIEPQLAATAVPASTIDPLGEWEQKYSIWVALKGNYGSTRLAGALRIHRKSLPNGNVQVDITQSDILAGNRTCITTASATCAGDRYASPISWQISTEMRESSGSLIPYTRTSTTGYVVGNNIVLRGEKDRVLGFTGPLSASWLLFDVVQRLPYGLMPSTFDMLDDLELLKPNQCIAQGHTVDAVVGGRRMRLRSFEQTGPGILPYTYWVDEGHRLIAAVGGCRTFIIDANATIPTGTLP